MLIVDAHLDLAYCALRGRDLRRRVEGQPADDEGTPSVSLPDLAAGGVGLACGTIFCEPASRNAAHGYRTPDEAAAVARSQLDWYERVEAEGLIRRVRTREDLPAEPASTPLCLILLMEGADPLRDEEDVRWWFARGLRIVGLAWKRTRLAGGTGDPGPLTAEGEQLVRQLDATGMIHDVSHLAEEAFWQLMDRAERPIIATHSNCRAIIPTDRHLSDEMIRALVGRGGMMGINFYDRFLVPPAERDTRRATLADVVRQVRHACDVAGSSDCIGLGTDMDGGFGRERIPVEITSSADLPRVAEALSGSGFTDIQVRGIMGENWMRFYRQAMPQAER